MADATQRHGPLDALRERFAAASAASAGGVTLRDAPFLSQLALRCDAADAAALAAIGDAIGTGLPQAANTFTTGAEWSALWLGPDEWLLVGPDGAAAPLMQRVAAALDGRHVSLADVSASRAVLELSGPKARTVLMKGCGLDLHARAFKPGQCAQSTLARTQVILQQTDAAPSYQMFVRWSFAAYLATWLLDAMAEFTVAPPPAPGTREPHD